MRNLLAPRLLWLAFRRGPRCFVMYLEIALRLWFIKRGWRFPRAPWHRCGAGGCGYDPFDWPGEYLDRPQYPQIGEHYEYAKQAIAETLRRRAEEVKRQGHPGPHMNMLGCPPPPRRCSRTRSARPQGQEPGLPFRATSRGRVP